MFHCVTNRGVIAVITRGAWHRNLAFRLCQQNIADAVGLTSVHVSRVLRTLRANRDIADFSIGVLELADLPTIVIANLNDQR